MTERELAGKCYDCRWWTPNKQCEVPPEPATTRRFLWWTISRDPFAVAIDRMRRDRIVDHNESGWCRRMPTTLETSEDYGCGEFANKDTTHDH